MAWTSADLTAIETAIASGELRIRFSDGREVQYRSMEELIKAHNLIENYLNSAGNGGTVRSTYATFTKD